MANKNIKIGTLCKSTRTITICDYRLRKNDILICLNVVDGFTLLYLCMNLTTGKN